jgi:hypothetical protein
MWIKLLLAGLFIIVAVAEAAHYILLKTRERKRQAVYPKGPLPAERIRKERGGCGVHGCANHRPHSHVDELTKKIREK